jgi:hypothetical protein
MSYTDLQFANCHDLCVHQLARLPQDSASAVLPLSSGRSVESQHHRAHMAFCRGRCMSVGGRAKGVRRYRRTR